MGSLREAIVLDQAVQTIAEHQAALDAAMDRLMRLEARVSALELNERDPEAEAAMLEAASERRRPGRPRKDAA